MIDYAVWCGMRKEKNMYIPDINHNNDLIESSRTETFYTKLTFTIFFFVLPTTSKINLFRNLISFFLLHHQQNILQWRVKFIEEYKYKKISRASPDDDAFELIIQLENSILY